MKKPLTDDQIKAREAVEREAGCGVRHFESVPVTVKYFGKDVSRYVHTFLLSDHASGARRAHAWEKGTGTTGHQVVIENHGIRTATEAVASLLKAI